MGCSDAECGQVRAQAKEGERHTPQGTRNQQYHESAGQAVGESCQGSERHRNYIRPTYPDPVVDRCGERVPISSPNSMAAVGRTTYINESPMITKAVGETAYTIPAGMIDSNRPPRKALRRFAWPFSFSFNVVSTYASALAPSVAAAYASPSMTV